MTKLEFYVPEENAAEVKKAVFEAGAGKIGNYDCCSWETSGKGQFRPCEGSTPFIGKLGEIEKLKELKIEMVCEDALIDKVIEALKKAHPYETPAYHYFNVQS